MNKLSRACIYYRIAHGITQEQLARLCSVSRITLNRAENGKKVAKRTVAKIMEIVAKEKI